MVEAPRRLAAEGLQVASRLVCLWPISPSSGLVEVIRLASGLRMLGLASCPLRRHTLRRCRHLQVHVSSVTLAAGKGRQILPQAED